MSRFQKYLTTGLLLVAGTCLITANRVSAKQAGDSQKQPAPKPESQTAEQSGNDEPTLRVNVDLVNIFFSVKAKKGGQLITNLEKNDFQVSEDGKPQTIKSFSRESDLPLTLGLLIDVSASQENLIDIEKNAASAFFSSVIRPKDEAFLISFGKDTNLLQDYTNSPKLLRTGLNDLRGDGNAPTIGRSPIPVNTGPLPTSGTPKGTLLFDAIYLAANEKLRSEVGRKALVLITDGGDQGSFYKRNDAIEAAQRSDAIIYSIYYVDRQFYGMMGGMGMGMDSGGEAHLRKMSEETGGRVFTVSGKHPLNEIFQQLQDELRNQYSIGYSPTNSKRDGTFRHIAIKTVKDDARVQARSGYYATPNDAK